MGVTIHYRLRSTVPDAEQARDMVGRLRKRALDLPFENVEDIVELTGDDCDFQRREEACPYRWLLIQAQ